MDDFLERLSFVETSQTVKRHGKILPKLILFINQWKTALQNNFTKWATIDPTVFIIKYF